MNMAQKNTFLYIVAKEIGLNNDVYGENYHICATSPEDCFNQICLERWGTKKYKSCPAYAVYHQHLKKLTHNDKGKKKDAIEIKNHPVWDVEIRQNIHNYTHPLLLSVLQNSVSPFYLFIVPSTTHPHDHTQPYYVIAENTDKCFEYICIYAWASLNYKTSVEYKRFCTNNPSLSWDSITKQQIVTSTRYMLHPCNTITAPGVQLFI